MLITGNPLTDLLTYLALVLPLLSVAVILLRKQFRDNSLTVVMLLCLFLFTQRLLVMSNEPRELPYIILQNLFSLGEFLLTILLFRNYFHTDRMRIILNGFLVACFSCTVTYSLLEGFSGDPFGLHLIQYGLMVLLMIAMLVQMMNQPAAGLMGTPIFWIAVSNLFYFGFMLFWEAGKQFIFPQGGKDAGGMELFPLIVVAIRLATYALSIWFLEPEATARKMVVKHPAPERAGQVVIRGAYDLINEEPFMMPLKKTV
jgi:hypothetical protein